VVVFIEYSRNEGTMRRMCASLFKAGCLKIMDDVQSTGESVVITKRGAAIVKVVPSISESSDLFGFMSGEFRIIGDIEAPLLLGSTEKLSRSDPRVRAQCRV
jgi:antitoxin (DNA-binding transcriptional repressor) of toxin-antitoxin stability system